MKYEVRVTSYNWDEKRERRYIATDYSCDNASTVRIIGEGKKRPVLLRDYCIEEVIICEATTGRRILTFKGTDKPKQR